MKLLCGGQYSISAGRETLLDGGLFSEMVMAFCCTLLPVDSDAGPIVRKLAYNSELCAELMMEDVQRLFAVCFRDRERKLIVLSPSQAEMNWIEAFPLAVRSKLRSNGQSARMEVDSKLGGLGQVPNILCEAVADIDHGVGEIMVAQPLPFRDAGMGVAVSCF